jgi:hypothetical protein
LAQYVGTRIATPHFLFSFLQQQQQHPVAQQQQGDGFIPTWLMAVPSQL